MLNRKNQVPFLCAILALFLAAGCFLTPSSVLADTRDVTKTVSGYDRIEAITGMFSEVCGAVMEEIEAGQTVGFHFSDVGNRKKVLENTIIEGQYGMDSVTLSRSLFDRVTPLTEPVRESLGNINLSIERILRTGQSYYRVEGKIYRNAGLEVMDDELQWGEYRLKLVRKEHSFYGYFATELSVKKIQALEKRYGTAAYDAAAGKDIVNTALRYVGGKYVLGGTSLKNGVDCSGFVYCILKATGHYQGARLKSTGFASVGTAVDPKDARPGDLIVWDGHIAIYIGGGKMIHASNSKPYPQGGIKVSRIKNPYTYSKKHAFLGIRRVQ